jgi:hypothetical protein
MNGDQADSSILYLDRSKILRRSGIAYHMGDAHSLSSLSAHLLAFSPCGWVFCRFCVTCIISSFNAVHVVFSNDDVYRITNEKGDARRSLSSRVGVKNFCRKPPSLVSLSPVTASFQSRTEGNRSSDSAWTLI